MGSQKQLIYLQNKETGEIYYTRKNKKLVERKLKFKKFSRKLRKHVIFEEVKKPQKVKPVKTISKQKKAEKSQIETKTNSKPEAKKKKAEAKEAKPADIPKTKKTKK